MANELAFLAGKRCLVLDDEYLIALDIQQILEAVGVRVTCLSSAAEALEALGDGSTFDLAVLDFKLDKTGPGSTAIAARLVENGVPFIFLSGARRDEINAKSFADVPILEKPYQDTALIDALRQAMPEPFRG